jgi:hypothetical protein
MGARSTIAGIVPATTHTSASQALGRNPATLHAQAQQQITDRIAFGLGPWHRLTNG